MGLQFRTIRAAGAALVIATAMGAGGMTGMASALAVDPPSQVAIAGTVVDGDGAPIGGVPLVISEEHPEGGIAAVQVTTGTDGGFTADLFPWGTADVPARLSISTPAGTMVEVIGAACTQTWGVNLDEERPVAWAESAPEPLALVAETELLGEVCGTVATPPPGTGTGTNTGTGGQGNLTPPPTDTLHDAVAGRVDRHGPALAIGFVVGLMIAATFLTPRPGARRRG